MKTGVEKASNGVNGGGVWEEQALEFRNGNGLENGSSGKYIESRELMVDWRGRPADKRTTGTWKAAWFLNVLTTCEFCAMTAIGLNLVTYYTTELHQSVSKASNYTNHFLGTVYLLPFFWGFIADSYLGKYWTIFTTLIIYIVGLATLTYAASSDSLQPPDCVPTLTSACPPAGNRIMTPVTIALYIIAVGSAGIKPTASAMGADQFDDSEPTERAQGVHFFVWYFCALQLALLLATSLMVYLQTSISFGLGYGVLLGFVVVGLVLFLIGTPRYRNKPPSGSPLTRMVQVFVAAIRKRNLEVPKDKSLLYETKSALSSIKGSRKLEHSPVFTFLDKAAVIDPTEDVSQECPWRLCTVTQVEELKRIMGIFPIWATTCVVYVAYAQLNTFLLAQGLTMDRHLGSNFEIPAISLLVFGVITTVICIPLYDRCFIPLARRFTGNESGISPLQRIGTGMVLVVVAYLVAAAIETKRLHEIRDAGFQNSPVGTFVLDMKAFWLIPVFVVLAVVEVFTTIGQLEFFYNESTDSIRSLGTSFFYTSISLGYFLASAIVDVVGSVTKHSSKGGWLTDRINDGGLRNYYFLLSVIMGIDFLVFQFFAYFYRYKKTPLDSTDGEPREKVRHLM